MVMRQVANNTKNPNAYLLESPVGIDRVVQTLQIALSDLEWLEKSFGRAYLLSRKNEARDNRISNDDVFYPAVFQGVSDGKVLDMEDVLVNDNLDSYSFFYIDSDETVVDADYESHVENYFERDISLIVWFDMDRINKRTDIERLYPFQEELSQDIKSVISTTVFNPNERISLIRVTDNPKEIFREFSLDTVAAQNLVYPNGGLRFYLKVMYKGLCP